VPETGASAEAGKAARLWQEGRRDAAIAVYVALQARHPDDAGIAFRLGMAQAMTGQLVPAVRMLEHCVALAPGNAEAHDWLGRCLAAVHWWERGPEAIGALRALVEAQPDDPGRHMKLAVALLSCGRLGEAWPHYAWRWPAFAAAEGVRVPERPLERPDPRAWQGRRLLLFAEQGHGDSLQFLRYAPLAAAAAGAVVLEVPRALVRLAATTVPGAQVVADGEAVPAHDVAVPLLHLPWAFGTELESIPAQVPYLHADPGEAAAWARRVAGLPGLKVGLVWAGDPRPDRPEAHRIDRRRSMTLAALAPLAGVAGVSFVSLQLGAAAEQEGLALHDWTGELRDFADTAALMEALDLVITVDTACVHLAGALGRPVWLLNRFDSCWRWLRGREDSPWYPTLRQFRQAAPGEWGPVVAQVAEELRKKAVLF
jgi:hypothetical protein